MTKLTKEYLPAFVYLTDQILEYDFTSKRAESDNMYKVISDESISSQSGTIDERTVRRAFKFRKSLKEGEIIVDGDKRPSIKTLNALTSFHFDKQHTGRFIAMNKIYVEEIIAHYKNHEPSEKIVNILFAKPPEKLDFIQRNKEKLEDFVMLVTDQNFEKLKIELTKANCRFEAFEKKVADEQKLQNDLISDLQGRIDRLERKHKKASFVYRFFGAFGLFFVSIEYREADLHNFLDDFMNDYEGLTEDTIFDDLV